MTETASEKEMYEKVKSRHKRHGKIELPIFLCLAVVVVVLVGIILSIARFAGTYPRYWDFVSELSASTSYSYDHASFKVQAAGSEKKKVSAEAAYGIYTYLGQHGPGEEKKSIPETDCDVVMEYGDGSRMLLWDLLPEEQGAPHELFLHFDNGEGYTYTYIDHKADLETLMRYCR